RLKITSLERISAANRAASAISKLMIRISGASAKLCGFAPQPGTLESTTVTLAPNLTSRNARLLPMKPSPPVTIILRFRYREIKLLLLTHRDPAPEGHSMQKVPKFLPYRYSR